MIEKICVITISIVIAFSAILTIKWYIIRKILKIKQEHYIHCITDNDECENHLMSGGNCLDCRHYKNIK